jgi:hypothetical protein
MCSWRLTFTLGRAVKSPCRDMSEVAGAGSYPAMRSNGSHPDSDLRPIARGARMSEEKRISWA